MRKETQFILLIALGFVAITVIVIAISCAPAEGEKQVKITIDQNSYGIRRAIDYDAEVVCWRLYGNSIACLPFDEVNPRVYTEDREGR